MVSLLSSSSLKTLLIVLLFHLSRPIFILANECSNNLLAPPFLVNKYDLDQKLTGEKVPLLTSTGYKSMKKILDSYSRLSQPKPFYAFAIAPTAIQAQNTAQAIADEYKKTNRQVVIVDLNETRFLEERLHNYFLELLTNTGPNHPLAFFVVGWERLLTMKPYRRGYDVAPAIFGLNVSRDLFSRFPPIPLVFWMSDSARRIFSANARDFYDCNLFSWYF